MQAGPLSFRSRDGRLAWLATTLLLVLLALAYRAIVGSAFALPTHSEIEGWLFRPSQLPPLLVLAVAAWMVWRRRARLLALPAHRAPWLVASFLLLGGALFVWAHLTGAADLLFPSLSAQLVAFAAAARGRRGCRVVALPALTLLLGTRIPPPLQDEMIWRLQVWSSAATDWFVNALGMELSHAGVILRTADHSFQVIDGCSGFRGILILTLVALLVRELLSDSGWRAWLLLPLAPVLGFGLNVLRVAYVATSSNPEALAGAQGDHTPQGVAVLVAGTVLLYGLGFALAARRTPAPPAPASSGPGVPVTLAAGWVGLLVALSIGLSPFHLPERVRPVSELPEQTADWTSEPLIGDPLFFGEGAQLLHRRYTPAGAGERAAEEAIEVFVGFERENETDTSLLFASKLEWPGPDWEVLTSEPATLWTLQREARLTIATRPPSSVRALVYSWRPGNLGVWRESLRSLLALDSTPFRRERPLTIVRVIAFAPHEGSQAQDHARQRLDRFLTRFRQPLLAF